jgi:DNA end-binding protein Ku
MPKTKIPKKETGKNKRNEESGGGERSQWTGSISFGLVNIPVRLTTAVRQKGLRFHMYRGKDNCKVRMKYICETDRKEVPREDIVKGYEIEEGRTVMLKEEEIEALAPKATHEINLIQFVDIAEIDPIYYSKAYYLVPQKNGKKAYHLFSEALKKSGKVAIGSIVMHSRQYLAALRVLDEIICLETLHFHDEIVAPQRVEKPSQPPTGREVEAAGKLIESLTEKFEPQALHDTYRETLLETMKKKKTVKTGGVEARKTEKDGAEIVDLMAALEASLKQSRKKAA